MILIDSNVLMYAAGSEHPNKSKSVKLLHDIAAGTVTATIDAEVLQEITHRYKSLDRWAEGRRVYELARTLFPEVLPITAEVMDRAKGLVSTHLHLSARDAVHAAVVLAYSLQAICTFDNEFDRIPEVKRICP